ncbi:hypothetical protein DRP04_14100 [Archaeoglobales archaeon]|nr:MAG: hypothetical protein DRP04_14100 [Archaeoglobales archaeon]
MEWDGLSKEIRLFVDANKKEIAKTAAWCGSTAALFKFAPEPNIVSYTAENCLEGLIEIAKAVRDFKNDPCRFVDPEYLNDPNYREKVPRICIEKIGHTRGVTASSKIENSGFSENTMMCHTTSERFGKESLTALESVPK